jgi:hypothetical protein
MKTAHYYFTKSKNVFTYLVAIVLIVSLASCGSTGSMSSFAKRKYLKGHFSDPVDGLSSKSVSGSMRSTIIAKHKVLNREHENMISSNPSPVVSQSVPAAETKTPALNHKQPAKPSVATVLPVVPIVNNGPVVTERQPESITSVNQTTGNEDGHHYFGRFLLAALLALIFLILGIALLSGFLLIISYLCWLAAIVFFILWIIHL